MLLLSSLESSLLLTGLALAACVSLLAAEHGSGRPASGAAPAVVTPQPHQPFPGRVAHALAHDVRAPILTIDGFARILRENPAGPEAGHLLTRVCAGTELLQARLGAVIDYCRFEGRTLACTSNLSLRDLFEAALKDVLPKGGGPFEVEIGDLPRVHGDRAVLGEAVRRLVANAVRFSGGPAPRRLTIEGATEPTRQVFRISNPGPGIQEPARRRLFELFGIAHSGAAEGSGAGGPAGVGMGLATVRLIVEKHGGEVWAECGDQRTSFVFTLPMCRQNACEEA